MPEHLAKILSALEASAADRKSETTNGVVEKVSGRPPQKFDSWVQENKVAWQ
jgi:festuclavine dehydrogenase